MKYKNLISTFGLFIITFTLSSCGWFKCKIDGKMLVKSRDFSQASLSNKRRNAFVEEEIAKLIKSPDIIDFVKTSLSKNQKYESYLSNKKFADKLEINFIGETDVLSLKYRHSDRDFVSEVINTWMDVASKELLLEKKLAITDLDSLYNRLLREASSDRILDAVFNELRKQNMYAAYLSQKDLAEKFEIKHNLDDYTVTVSYRHSDINFANKVLDTWRSIMFANYGYPFLDRSDHSYYFAIRSTLFSYKEKIDSQNSESIYIYIPDKDLQYLEVIGLDRQGCQ